MTHIERFASRWRKSARSNASGGCVEVARLEDVYAADLGPAVGHPAEHR